MLTHTHPNLITVCFLPELLWWLPPPQSVSGCTVETPALGRDINGCMPSVLYWALHCQCIAGCISKWCTCVIQFSLWLQVLCTNGLQGTYLYLKCCSVRSCSALFPWSGYAGRIWSNGREQTPPQSCCKLQTWNWLLIMFSLTVL